MKPVPSMLLAALLAAGSAQAQFLPDQPASYLSAQKRPAPFNDSFQAYPHTYGSNEAENPNHKLFKESYRTDPRLIMGLSLTPSLSLEAGYVNLQDRGFRGIDQRDPGHTAGALGAAGYSAHAAVKYTLPISEEVSAYAKIGRAHSYNPNAEHKEDTGVYAGIGAQVKVNKRTTIDAKYENHGNAGKKWGSASNAGGLKADLKMGF